MVRRIGFLLIFLIPIGFLTWWAIPRQQTVIIQPYNGLSLDHVDTVEATIQKIFNCETVVHAPIGLPKQAYYHPRNRFRADSLIRIQKRSISRQPGRVKILGLTNLDISTTKGEFMDWGVFGLGYLPGNSSVVSTFRLGSDELLIERLKKVCIHELGHNFGLRHCTSDSLCIMADACGKRLTVDRAELRFCTQCKIQIIGHLR